MALKGLRCMILMFKIEIENRTTTHKLLKVLREEKFKIIEYSLKTENKKNYIYVEVAYDN